jgi:hypothetical protein
MKNLQLLLATFLAIGGIASSEAAVIPIRPPGIVVTYRQPLQAIIQDSYGNTFQQIVYYDPYIGGIDINLSWAGPNASIYFPELGIGYIWYNGYWVDEGGYYWDRGNQVYIGYPYWNVYWTDYWGRHWDDKRYGRWHDRWGDRWHWRRDKWRDKDDDDWRRKNKWNDDWRDKDDDNWRRQNKRDGGWRDKDDDDWRRQGKWQGGWRDKDDDWQGRGHDDKKPVWRGDDDGRRDSGEGSLPFGRRGFNGGGGKGGKGGGGNGGKGRGRDN